MTLSYLLNIIAHEGAFPWRGSRAPSIFRGLGIMTCTAMGKSLGGGIVPAGEMVYIVDDDASVREEIGRAHV